MKKRSTNIPDKATPLLTFLKAAHHGIHANSIDLDLARCHVSLKKRLRFRVAEASEALPLKLAGGHGVSWWQSGDVLKSGAPQVAVSAATVDHRIRWRHWIDPGHHGATMVPRSTPPSDQEPRSQHPLAT